MTAALCLIFVTAFALPAQTRQNAQWYYQEGITAFEGEMPYLAIERFKDAIRLNPTYFDPLVGLARVYYYLDEYDEALRYVEQASVFGKENPRLLNIHGRVLLALGKTEDAAKIFQTVLAKEPYNVDALLGIAEFSLSKGDEISALQQYQRTLQYSQNDRRILLALSLMNEARGNRNQAEQYLLRALDAYPESPMVQAMAAEYFLRRNNFPQAEFHAQTALSLFPGYEKALELLGNIKLRSGAFGEAIAAMDQLISANRENSGSWYVRGMAYLQMSKPTEALASFERVLQISPHDEITRIVLEDTVINFFPPEEASRSKYAAYHFDQASQFRKKNLNSRASFHYKRGLAVAPLDVTGRQQYADFLKATGQRALFYEQLKALEKLGVQNAFVKDNLEIYGSLLTSSVSADWQVDQFLVDRDPLIFRVFYMPGQQNIEHPLAESYLSRYVQSLMLGSSKISATKDRNEFSGEIDPRPVTSESQAFATARLEVADYYVMIDFSESDEDFLSRLALYVARTGNKIRTYTAFRSGNFKVQNSVFQTLESMTAEIPLRGRLLRRTLDEGLINLGAGDGLKQNDVLHIVSPDAYVLRSDAPGFVFTNEKKTGTFTVGKTDEMISEGIVIREGFFDRINVGDVILRDPESLGRPQDATASFPFLYNKIRAIR